MKTIYDVITLDMIKILPGDYEKFVTHNTFTTDVDIPSNDEELKIIKYRTITFLLSDFQSIQMGFSVPIKPIPLNEEISEHRLEFIEFFRKLHSNYTWILSELPEAEELLSPLWANEFTDDEIMYVFQNYQNVVEKLPSQTETEEEAAISRKKLTDMGCVVSE